MFIDTHDLRRIEAGFDIAQDFAAEYLRQFFSFARVMPLGYVLIIRCCCRNEDCVLIASGIFIVFFGKCGLPSTSSLTARLSAAILSTESLCPTMVMKNSTYMSNLLRRTCFNQIQYTN